MHRYRVGRSVIALALACAGLSSGLAAQEVQPPVPIKDINSLSDGHGGLPPGYDYTYYPLTASSYPDTPRAANGRVFFLAQDSSGQRKLYRYNPAAPESSLVMPVAITGVPAAGANPRSLTVFNDALYFIADSTDGKVFKATDHTGVAPVAFTGATIDSVDALTATATQLTALALTGGRHRVWHLAGAAFTGGMQAAAGVSYTRPASLTAWGSNFAFCAVTDPPSTTHPRSLIVVETAGASPGFHQRFSGNPTQLTDLGEHLLFVNKVGELDALNVFVGTSASPSVANHGITNMIPVTIDTRQWLFFIADADTATPSVGCWESKFGARAPKPSDAASLVSVTAIAPAAGTVYVLGVKNEGGVNRSALWQFTASSDATDIELLEVHTFPLFTCPHDLVMWGGGTPRAVFAAWDTLQATNRPILVTNRPGTLTQWDHVEVPSVKAASTADQLLRLGNRLFFRANHLLLGSEPWSWLIPGA